MKKEIKWLTVTEYIDDYNKIHEKKITRKNVYKLINSGELNAQKNEKGYWIIKVVTEPEANYTVKEYMQKHNSNNKNPSITIKKVREMAINGELKAKKVAGKWIILEHPKKSK